MWIQIPTSSGMDRNQSFLFLGKCSQMSGVSRTMATNELNSNIACKASGFRLEHSILGSPKLNYSVKCWVIGITLCERHEPNRENTITMRMMEGLKSRTYKEGYGRVRVVGGGHDQKLGYLKHWLLLSKKDLLSMSVVIGQEIVPLIKERIVRPDIKAHFLAAR